MEELTIPPLPSVVLDVIKFDATNPKLGASDLERVVAPDRGISADLLRVSNSAFYGRSGKVKLLRDALAVLGIKATKNLVIYLSTRALAANVKSEMFKKYLNQFPIYCALYAQRLALESSHKNISDECFLGALLHTIGMNVMSLTKQLHYSSMLEACEKNKWDLKNLEKQSYGVTHVELGRKAAEKWQLPETYRRLMDVSLASDANTLLEPIDQVIFLAAYLSSAALAIPVPAAAKETMKLVCAKSGISESQVFRFSQPDIVEQIKQHPFAQMAGS